MSYALGTKMVPGQINFLATQDGRIPDLQPLIQAGLPYAPYVQHGSWITGQPDIARYGRDPYRGLGSGYTFPPEMLVDQAEVREAVQAAVTAAVTGVALIGVGVVTGGAVGAVSGLMKKPILGAILGAVAGGVIGAMATSQLQQRLASPEPVATAGLSGVLAVL